MHPVVTCHGNEVVVFERTKYKVCIAVYLLLLSCPVLLVACTPPPTAIDLKQALIQSYSCPLLALSDVTPISIEPFSDQAYQVTFTYLVTMTEAPDTLAKRFAEWTYQDDALLRLRKAYGQEDFRLNMNSAAKAEAVQALRRIDAQAEDVLARLNVLMPCQSADASVVFDIERRAARNAAMKGVDEIAVPMALTARAQGRLVKIGSGWHFESSLSSAVEDITQSVVVPFPRFTPQLSE
jgi:hypothetical protein